MSVIDKAVEWAVSIANDNRHGYSQANRWGNPDYDCSSLLIDAWEKAGVPVKTRGATYTGNMLQVFKSCGFADVTSSCNLYSGAYLQKGDVLLNTVNHTAMYIGNGLVVHARSSEGNSIGGDQSGNEIRTQPYFNYPWNYVLRYKGAEMANAQTSAPVVTLTTVSLPQITVSLPQIKKGATGNVVKSLQLLLIGYGYLVGTDGADGDFGNNTYNAVIKFQTDKRLGVDGVVGKDTWSKLISG